MKVLSLIFGTSHDIKFGFENKLVIYFGVLYLLTTVDSYFVWNYKNLLICIIGFLLLMTIPYVKKNREFGLSKANTSFFLVYFIYAVTTAFQMAPDNANINYYIVMFFYYLPLFLFILWPPKLLYGVYRAFFKIIIIFSIGSIVVSVLGIFSLLDYVPCVELEPHEALHENAGVYYRMYCGILTNYGGIVDYFLIRACGFLCEPGHWAVTLSIIYAIERLLKHAPNFVIVTCGFFTFSSVFIIVLILTELCVNLKRGMYFKYALYFVLFLVSLITIYLTLPNSIKDPIDAVFFERNLKDIGEALDGGGSLNDALDTRVNKEGQDYYDRHIQRGNIFWGDGAIRDSDFILSDYRLILVQQGILGLLLVILTMFASVKNLSTRNKIPLFAVLLIILLHRAWMLQYPYFCLMVFIGRTQICATYNKIKLKHIYV